jgi:hypothetical protein
MVTVDHNQEKKSEMLLKRVFKRQEGSFLDWMKPLASIFASLDSSTVSQHDAGTWPIFSLTMIAKWCG